MSLRKLPLDLEALLGRAMKPRPQNDFRSIIRVAALARAFDEVGIEAKAVVCEVSFNPDHRGALCPIIALGIQGCVTDGSGCYGWKPLIDKARVRPGQNNHYARRMRTRAWSWEDLARLSTDAMRERMEHEFEQMSSLVQQWHLQQETSSSNGQAKRSRL
jgi:hypothetical protein